MFTPKYKVGDIVKAEILKNEWQVCRVERIIKKCFFKFEYVVSCSYFRHGKTTIYLQRKQKDLIAVRGDKGE